MPGQQRRRAEQNRELSKEEKEVNASSDVTLALRRTHDMMMAELSRSQFAHDTLKESTAALSQLSETYSTLDTMLSRSRNLLGTLLTSQKSDTWYLETAFYILLATIAWLVWRRLLYGPTWLVLWYIPKVILNSLKLCLRLLVVIFTSVGVIGGQKTDVGVSPVVGRETVVHSSGTRRQKVVMPGQEAPSIKVGGGGKGGPMRATGTTPGNPQESSGGTVSEEVGKIIDGGHARDQGEGTSGEEGTNGDAPEGEEVENQPNPKKRMWEEEKEAAKETERKKDEL
jgi:protein transport protein SEC20